jgi:hypothetical protein
LSAKFDRTSLVNRIAKAARLSQGTGTEGYFDKTQLVELALFVETQNKTIADLKTAFEEMNSEKKKQAGNGTQKS